MSDSGDAPDAGSSTTATSMPRGICWRRVFASWPVVMTGTCAWMREMHAQKKMVLVQVLAYEARSGHRNRACPEQARFS
jgi:hypothetical protein